MGVDSDFSESKISGLLKARIEGKSPGTVALNDSWHRARSRTSSKRINVTTPESRLANLEAKFAAFVEETRKRLDGHADDIGAVSEATVRIEKLLDPNAAVAGPRHVPGDQAS